MFLKGFILALFVKPVKLFGHKQMWLLTCVLLIHIYMLQKSPHLQGGEHLFSHIYNRTQVISKSGEYYQAVRI